MRSLEIYALGLFVCFAPAAAGQACEAADVLEPNDSCAAAASLASGSYPGLTLQGSAALGGVDEDHFLLTLSPGEQLAVDAFFSTAIGDIDLELFSDQSCTQLVDASYSLTDDEAVSYVNTGPSTASLVLVARGFGPGFDCNDYDLLVAVTPDPCATMLPDAAEDDDDCSTATPLFGGSLSGRNVRLGDPDWFSLTLEPEAEFSIEIAFQHAQADLDLRLYGACPTTGINPLASSESQVDTEAISFANHSATTIDLWIEVYVWSGSQGSCNDYQLVLELAGGEAATAVCFGDGSEGLACPCGNLGSAGEGCANSTGVGAVLSATGTDAFVNDDLVLHATGGPPGQPGMMVQGAALVPVPFRDGILCLGNPTERLEVVFLDSTGAGDSIGSIVQAGNVAGPGVTTYYQYWFRDPQLGVCGLGSNLTNALRVDWN